LATAKQGQLLGSRQWLHRVNC